MKTQIWGFTGSGKNVKFRIEKKSEKNYFLSQKLITRDQLILELQY